MTPPRLDPAVEFTSVSKSFDGNRAVDAVNFSIQTGEFFSLLGPSGCGKTTTLRLLAGFETADPGGEIRINGRRVNEERPWERGVGMVFQNYALFPHLTVERNVAFGLEQRRVPRTEVPGRVARALELVRLDPREFARRAPSQLSGGQRQRVALARALVLEPRLLLLDEPLGALDLKLRKEMQLELKSLNRALGITFVYVTHDQEEALTMSDRIAVMDRGRIAQLGSPADVYENPRTAFVASFIGESNFFSGRAESRGDRRWRIVGAHGAFEVTAEPGVRVSAGTEVGIAVRPEWMDVYPLDQVPAGENAVPGTVQEIIYLGETLHVLVALDAGGTAKVAVRNEGQLIKPIPWARGARAAVAWLPEDCQVLEPSE
ncbi:MAG: ABC transporter ATP-binding protein [Gemmatimonadetes bacterium]|nr:ABC transporter ATP-binding protein [Gemmatimonadota bacterium]